ncbi:hypothetical protein TorRG33x02_330460 [Trema orientale]|uniref:Uncharacterized protein n=1 Tax=Trema orientale TaxID=63057 RepID=A0A2P5B772_TREOI|nr:hypothetical protein TorRG33x02_330460 [Trema orientale]
MDMEHVLRLCKHLKLDEDDGLVVPLSKENFTMGKDQMEFCLVGKIMGNIPVNREGFENNM